MKPGLSQNVLELELLRIIKVHWQWAIRRAHRPHQWCWLLSLDSLTHYEHIIQSLSKTCLSGIVSCLSVVHKFARYPWNDAVRLNWLTVCFYFINWGIGLGGEWQSASCKFPLLHNRTQCWYCSCTGPKAGCSVSAEQVPKNCAHLCWICGHCRSCERCEPRGGMCCLGLKLLTEFCILIL